MPIKEDKEMIDSYLKAMRQGYELVQSSRLVVVGMHGVGKTSMVYNLINDKKTNIKSLRSTEGIEVYKCQVINNRWVIKNATRELRLQSIVEDSQQHEAIEENTAHKIPDAMKPFAEAYASGKNQICNSLKTEDELFSNSSKQPPSLSIWDFAGQNIYYSTHHFFLNYRSIYLLVMDVSKDFNEEIEDCRHLDKCYGKFTYMDAFKFWLNSIHLYSAKECNTDKTKSPVASVFLVGTHKDNLPFENEVEKEQFKEQYFQELLKPFINSPKLLARIHRKKFLVNNLEPDSPVFDQIRHLVNICAREQFYWNELIPARWIELEKSLEETFKTAKSDLITFEDVKMAGKGITYEILDDNELMAFLKVHHAMGNILYFDTEELKNYVISDPCWAIVAFKTFINHVRDRSPLNTPEYFDYKNLAILKPKLIDEIMEQSDPRVRPFKTQVLAFLERLDVIARPVNCEYLCKGTDDHLAFSPKKHKIFGLLFRSLSVE